MDSVDSIETIQLILRLNLGLNCSFKTIVIEPMKKTLNQIARLHFICEKALFAIVKQDVMNPIVFITQN